MAWCAVPDNHFLGPNNFNNETVRGVDYYHMLEIFVQAEAQKLPLNAFL